MEHAFNVVAIVQPAPIPPTIAPIASLDTILLPRSSASAAIFYTPIAAPVMLPIVTPVRMAIILIPPTFAHHVQS